jgi:NADPH:quinone reductase-like Zn-dependent oxidoreductase
VQSGQPVLFMAAAGGVGLVAGQWGRALAAKMIGVAGGEEKCRLSAANGYAHVIDRSAMPRNLRVASGIFAGSHPAFSAIVIPSCRGEDVMVEIELVLELAGSSP